YETRLQKQGSHLTNLVLPTPRWDGKADLKGKKLILLWEQGYGDNIQFIRFARKLASYDPKKLYVLCPKDIAPLFKQLPKIEVIGVDFSSRFDIPAHDYQLNIPSLPYVLGVNDESQFLCAPYLSAPKANKRLFSGQIQKNKNLRIGLCWAGSPNHQANNERSCGLDFFIPLLAYQHISWYSLQKFPDTDELQILNDSGIANIGLACANFADTAAVISELDLILSVDTAIAHLAGAIGKPVWLLMRYQTEWRHPRGRTTSPWYPSMRLMRQAKPGDWDSVLQQVETELESQYHLTKIEGT
ncbi:MAG: hypothetical protein K2Q33_00585, partial [Gammaproteobacteria bacterium]|nr:hypothetical protein [Gammaproteobacteria bacterium]